jgi:MFS family permease
MEIMKKAQASRQSFSTVLAFALIPLSGLATDIYIPSLPDMAEKLHTTPAAVQLTLAIFLVSYGACQLVIGSVLDSYGRYRPNLLSLLLFSIASFVIATVQNIQLIYAMRVVQGITVATIVVSKRAYFVDLFSGEKLKHYTSLFSIIWSSAPIIAPFIGGFLQASFGWQSNFYFLGCFALVMLLLELVFSGESLTNFQPFHLPSITRVYWSMIKTRDFTAGVLILGLCFSMLLLYGMASPFLIERVLHYPAMMTGNCSLVSGLAVLAGGLLSKALIRKPFLPKVRLAAIIQIVAAVGIGLFTLRHASLYSLLAFIIVVHLLSGFIFNNLFSYCLMLFPHNAGKASGLTGGGFGMLTSVISYCLVAFLKITSQPLLGMGYALLAAGVLLLLVWTRWNKHS